MAALRRIAIILLSTLVYCCCAEPIVGNIDFEPCEVHVDGVLAPKYDISHYYYEYVADQDRSDLILLFNLTLQPTTESGGRQVFILTSNDPQLQQALRNVSKQCRATEAPTCLLSYVYKKDYLPRFSGERQHRFIDHLYVTSDGRDVCFLDMTGAKQGVQIELGLTWHNDSTNINIYKLKVEVVRGFPRPVVIDPSLSCDDDVVTADIQDGSIFIISTRTLRKYSQCSVSASNVLTNTTAVIDVPAIPIPATFTSSAHTTTSAIHAVGTSSSNRDSSSTVNYEIAFYVVIGIFVVICVVILIALRVFCISRKRKKTTGKTDDLESKVSKNNVNNNVTNAENVTIYNCAATSESMRRRSSIESGAHAPPPHADSVSSDASSGFHETEQDGPGPEHANPDTTYSSENPESNLTPIAEPSRAVHPTTESGGGDCVSPRAEYQNADSSVSAHSSSVAQPAGDGEGKPGLLDETY